MRPSFNTTGPCVPGEHYMLPPGDRLGRVLRIVEEEKFFTLHAGRQTGKTTCVRWLVKHLNEGGRSRAMWVDLQTAREQPEPAAAFRTILGALDLAVQRDASVSPMVGSTWVGCCRSSRRSGGSTGRCCRSGRSTTRWRRSSS